MRQISLFSLLVVSIGCGPTVHYPPKDTNPSSNPAPTMDSTSRHIADLKSPDPKTRQSAAIFLGNPGDKRAVAPLIGVLKDPNAKVRVSAARALAIIGPEAKEAVQPLIANLSDGDPEVAGAAAYALGEIGKEAKAAIPALSQMFKGKNNDLRAQAGGALKKIDPESAYEAGVERP